MKRWDFLLKSLVGPSGLEPPTSCLSGTRSNLLSYEPMWLVKWSCHLVFHCFSLSFLVKSEEWKVKRWDPLDLWWRWRDSNSWPPACRAGALPAELHPHKSNVIFGETEKIRSQFLWLRFPVVLSEPSLYLDMPRKVFYLPRCQHWAIFPCRFQQSIFATAELNFCVRNGNRWTLCVITPTISVSLLTEYWTTKSIVLFISSIVYVTSRLTYNTFSIERRWSSRTFRYGYLVTT